MNGFEKMTIGNVWRGTVDHTFERRDRDLSVLEETSLSQDQGFVSPQQPNEFGECVRVSQGYEENVYAKGMAEKLVIDLRETKRELRRLQEEVAARIARAIESTKKTMDSDFSIMLSSCLETHNREKSELVAKLHSRDNRIRVLEEVNRMTLADVESRALQKLWRSLDSQKLKRWRSGVARTNKLCLENKVEEELEETDPSVLQLGRLCSDLFETLCDRNGRLRSSNLRHFLRQKDLLGSEMVLGDVDIIIQKHSGGRQYIREEDMLDLVKQLISRASMSSEEYTERISHMLLIRKQQV